MENDQKQQLEFEGKIKAWGLSYLRQNYWRVASMCDADDLVQEAFLAYWSVKFNHPKVCDESEFLKLYKARLRGIMKTRSASCFPNPYNFSKEGGGCVSLTSEDGGDLLEMYVSGVCSSGSDLEVCLGVMDRLPEDLKGVFLAVVKEALGVEQVPSKIRRRLSGRHTVEPLNKSLARMFGLSPDRDLFAEMRAAIAIELEDENVST